MVNLMRFVRIRAKALVLALRVYWITRTLRAKKRQVERKIRDHVATRSIL